MHFVKTIVSLFALSSFAAAQVHGEELEAALAARDVAYEDLLFAREEYIEKRELFKRLPGPGSCKGMGLPGEKTFTVCYNRDNRPCGDCRKTAKRGEGCLCKR
ncbi:unnamed protein product [Clonostachys rhizophaga]|uniref:Uncharacterized protein n=1 Tax=Clonostachys rhizophaga TaxID=160324 RepID=A0A9N9YNU1_9HYPO|nr:unnamed protein product [Clonostachys rhizophaga]